MLCQPLFCVDVHTHYFRLSLGVGALQKEFKCTVCLAFFWHEKLGNTNDRSTLQPLFVDKAETETASKRN